MRCLSCNNVLTDFEATRRYPSGGFIDLCNKCFKPIKNDISYVIERHDLEHFEDIYDNGDENVLSE